MKKIFIYLLTLLSLNLSAQDSWINIQYMSDNYPTEISWEILDGYGTVVIESDSNFVITTLFDTTIALNSGLYTLNVNDIFGDGLGASQWGGTDGWFLIQNDCQDTLTFVAGDFGSLYTDTLTIAPCAPPAPPTPGCTDSNALNYDPTATIDDGTCIFPPCGGLSFANSIAKCDGGQAEIKWEWQTTSSSPNCDVIGIHVQNGGYPLLWNSYWSAGLLHEFTTMAGQGQQAPGWSSDYYAVLEFVDGTFSDTIFQTVVSCIPGCMDSTSVSYNPWATFDDGLCAGAACPPDENDITLQITLDNWPGETGWHIISGTDTVASFPEGTYDFNDIGLTYTYDFCVDTTTTFAFTVTDLYGDGLAGSTSGGTIDGQISIYNCNGDTIWYLQNPAFGNSFTEDSLTSISCGGPIIIDGCMDQAYQEYDSLANNNLQYLCITPHIAGCTDTSAFNYDPNASINQIVPFCDYTLTIEDDGGDGWLNSYIGIEQNGVLLGTYAMGPGSYSQSFELDSILTSCVLNVYYFEIKSQQTNPQQLQFQTMHNSFTIADSLGNILMEEGTNPFANNGLGALQGFSSPLWTVYSVLPYCGDYCIPTILGCMDPTAFNYDSTANTTDNNCIVVINGCTNPIAFNYNILANVDDSTCTSIIIGCMDSLAFNFNPTANTNDPLSCIPVILGCMDDTMFNYNAAANTDDGTCIPVVYGCTDQIAFNYDSSANTNNGSCVPVIFGCTDPIAFNYNPLANTNDSSCVSVIYGCTDNTMFNYNPLANTDNGTCIPFINGCTDTTMWNYDVNANTDNGSCLPYIFGCTDSLSFNFNPLANTDNNGCIPVLSGCTDSLAINYNPLANTNDNSCVPFILGCTDSTATNYNLLANTDDGSCIETIYGCTSPIAFNYNPLANVDDNSCTPVVNGCIDPTQFNYDPLANTDDGSCIEFIYGCTDVTAFNYNPLANTDNGSCSIVVNGCTDSTQFNYDPTANTDNGSCVPFIYGCTDNIALNFDPLANTLDNSCCYIGGCTTPTAVNYNPNACYDDGSCVTPILGCTDVSAYNYNPLANVSDSTACNYDAGCYGGPGIPYWLNDGCYAWVIDVDDYCCTNSWDASCQSMYDYCELGWPTSIEDISSLGIVVYPNPTKDIITIETRLEIEVQLYDITGKTVINELNAKRLDLSQLPNGLYNMIILYNGSRYSKKVIKQ